MPTQEIKSGSVSNSRKPTRVAAGISKYVKGATLSADAQDMATIISVWLSAVVTESIRIMKISVVSGTFQKKGTKRLDIKQAINAPQTATMSGDVAIPNFRFNSICRATINPVNTINSPLKSICIILGRSTNITPRKPEKKSFLEALEITHLIVSI